MTPFALPQHALFGHVQRVESEVVARVERKIVGDACDDTEIARLAELRREEARLPLHRWIGVLEVGKIQHRLAEDFEIGILIADRRRFLIMDDPRGADTPQRRRTAFALTRREAAVLEFRDVAVAPRRPVSRDARVVLRHDGKRLHKPIAEVVRERVPVGANDVALRLFERDVTGGRQRSRVLVVDDFVGGEDVVVVKNLNVAACNHAIASRVVHELVALQVHRLRAVDLLVDLAEHAARRLSERTRFAVVGRDAGILRVSGQREQAERSHAGERASERTSRPVHREMNGLLA